MKPLYETDLPERVMSIMDNDNFGYKDYGVDTHNGNWPGLYYKIRFENYAYVEITEDKIHFWLGWDIKDYTPNDENIFLNDLKRVVKIFEEEKLPVFDENFNVIVDDEED